MSVELGSAYIQLIPSLRGAGNTISRELSGIGGAAGVSAGKKAGGLFAGTFAKALAPLAALTAGAIGATAVAGFFTDSIAAASNLEQSLGGVDAIFGKSADSIHKWAKEAQTSVGLSESAYNDLANVIGSQLKNAGTSMDQVGKKTNDLIKTGANLAATFGGTTADAVSAISSALKGERDPIEQYGVSLNQAAVDAQAAALGFKKVGGTLSVAGSQAATMALILKQTSSATGQFAAQSDTLAEKQQIFAATLENVKAKIGSAFLPALSSVVGALSNLLDPALTAIQPKLDGLAAKLSTAGTAISGFFTGLTAPPSAAGGLTAPLDRFVAAGAQVRQFIVSVQPILQTFLGVLGQVGPVLGSAFATIGPQLAAALTQVLPALAQIIPPLAKAVVELLPSFVQLVIALTPLIPPLAQTITALAPVISKVADVLVFLIQNAIIPLIQNSAGFISFFAQMADGGLTAGQAMEGLRGKFGPVIQVIGTFGTVVGLVLGNAYKTISEFPLKAVTALARAGTILVDSGRALIQGFIDGISGMVGAVGNAVGGIMDFVRGFFPESPAKRGPFSGSGWTGLKKSGGAIAGQFTSGFNDGVAGFGDSFANTVPGQLRTSMTGTFDGASRAPSRSVLIANKTNVRLEDLVDVRIARNSAEENRAFRMGYQPVAR